MYDVVHRAQMRAHQLGAQEAHYSHKNEHSADNGCFGVTSQARLVELARISDWDEQFYQGSLVILDVPLL